MEQENKIIVAFHTGRGGSFHNPGHRTFIGEKNFQDLISLNSNNLFEQDRDEKGRFCKHYMTDCSGKIIVEPGHIQDETGCLDFDGSEYLIGCLEEAGNDNNEKLQEWLKDPSFYYHGRCWD